SYMSVQRDVLDGKVDLDLRAFGMEGGLWLGTDAEIEPGAKVSGPVYVGPNSRVEAGAELREYTVLGANVVVKAGAFLHRAVVHDNVYVGQGAHLRGCVVGKNTDIMRNVRLEEGSVIGDECVVEEEAFISSDVKVYPFKT